jgi:hypothetical protein
MVTYDLFGGLRSPQQDATATASNSRGRPSSEKLGERGGDPQGVEQVQPQLGGRPIEGEITEAEKTPVTLDVRGAATDAIVTV